MPNPWFRCYSEFADDPKVQMMSEQMQRRLVMLFCNRCKEETLHETQRAFHWRITPVELAETKAVFIENGFIDDRWNLLNWNRRQFLSDSSTERVRKYRQSLKQDETLPKQDGNVSVTAPDTDTDTEQKHKKQKQAASAFVLPEWIDRKVWESYEEMRKKIRKPMTDGARVLAVGKLKKLEAQGHHHEDVLNQSILNAWQGLFEVKATNGGNNGNYKGKTESSLDAARQAQAIIRAHGEEERRRILAGETGHPAAGEASSGGLFGDGR